MLFHKNKKAFTLIELLVVIAIIGVLSTMAIIALSNARTKARDAKRVADIKQISTALELYYADNNSYPTIITPGNSLVSPDGTKTYMGKIPNNPTPMNDGNCSNTDYSYSTNINNSSFSVATCIGNDASSLTSGSIFISNNSGIAPCGQATVIDVDGNTYNTVKVGTQCWMKENLRTKKYPNGNCINPGCPNASVADNGLGRSCYNNDENICTSDGALYTWAAVMNGSTTAGAQGICPSGWHIPSDTELHTLEQYLTDVGQTCDANRSLSAGLGDCYNSCQKLKVGGSSGLNMVATGIKNSASNFQYRGTHWSLTSSSQYDSSNSYVRWAYFNNDGIDRASFDKTYGLSVRCLKN
ncbi:MAG: prepilin-type N-terminal cleavage/methylation domain-containing protein [Candidatus Falkowbacteria bacterium]|nr:prepilin-type N-terminal cleavage/methylation domain-containing protein [Candidatus Falkowbacteria bacterium]